jgi:glycosyltransferase involved in cell wall biosynthesis
MKILHFPRNPGSEAWIISRAQRKLGYKSDVMVLESKKINLGFDYNFHLERYPQPIKYLVGSLKFPNFFIKSIRSYDVFHIHFRAILPFQLDAILLKFLKKKVIFHFSGCDIRLNCPHPYCQKNINKKIRLIEIAKRVSNGIIVYNPDLLDFIPEAKFFPYAIDLEEWKPEKEKRSIDKETVKILHAPTDRFIKGTDIILNAINELKKEGYNIQLLLIENVPREFVKKYYLNADIVIDQIILGWYGTFAAECMAIGKPVCAYIREDLLKFAKKCPIVNVNEENIKDKLRKLIENEKMREKLGKKGIEYAKKVHDSIKIAKNIINFYNSC